MSGKNNDGKRTSRRSFVAGAAAGAFGAWALTSLPRRCFSDPDRPPWISEFYVNSFWFEAAGLYQETLNAPLTEKIKADIAIIGGGFTGLASAYHLKTRFPDKRIVVLESAYCGYGASGRNGGMAIPMHPLVFSIGKKEGPEAAAKFQALNAQGLEQIKVFVDRYQVDCDLEETGILVLALDEEKLESMAKEEKTGREIGLPVRLLDRQAVQKELKSERYAGGLNIGLGAIINPAKLARGMKRVVEGLGVEIYERTRVLSVEPGSKVWINTEQGEVESPVLVLAANGYTSKLGFFKNRYTPLGNYVIATEPLSAGQLDSIGWSGRQMLWDTRTEFDYFRLSADNRIVFGGELAPYYYGSELSSGNYKPSLRMLEESLFRTFPQLSGVRITHRWGGTLSMTLDMIPAIGVTGPNKNIFYGLGYSGEGVVFSQLAGMIISQLIAREETDLTRLSIVNRSMPFVPPEPLRYTGVSIYKKLLSAME